MRLFIPGRLRIPLRWAPLLLCTGMIFVFSTDVFNTLSITHIEGQLMDAAGVGEAYPVVYPLFHPVQHILAFFLLGLTTFPLAKAGERGLRFAICYCGLVALSSELAQGFADLRQPAEGDVILNLFSGFAGIATLLIVPWLRWCLNTEEFGVLPLLPRLEFPVAEGPPTVLLVSEDPLALRLIASILRANGYSLLVAANPHQALLMAKNYGAAIDLLMTDVYMSQMRGSQLAEELSPTHQETRVLYMKNRPPANSRPSNGNRLLRSFLQVRDAYLAKRILES